MKKLCLALIAFSAALTLSAKDLHTVVLSTGNQMHCEKCEKRVTENLRYISGIKEIKAEAPKQTITVTYDADKTKPEAMIKSLAKLKYKVEVKEDKKL